MEPYTKEKEIAAIKALIDMGGYFAECFESDFEKMAENILNDYAIEMGTRLDEYRRKYFRNMREDIPISGKYAR
ncbi:MAG: hypothetical protein LBL04_14105 [Bacteroidales bacterium]|jgi:hypothetical protein|nr:hypothetical protein [Bacteroidales bacterium]